MIQPIFIDQSYFTGRFWIPPNEHPKANDDFIEAIWRGEDRFFVDLLGYNVTARLKNGLSRPEPMQKWIDLKNMLVDESQKTSIITNFIYRRYINLMITTGHELGGIKGLYSESEMREIEKNAVIIWNELSAWVLDTRDWFVDFYLSNKFKNYFFMSSSYNSYHSSFDPIESIEYTYKPNLDGGKEFIFDYGY